MIPRLVDAPWSKIRGFNKDELIESIKLSEGRTIAAEVVVTAPPLIDKISNVELAAGFGADIIILNFYDVKTKFIANIPEQVKSISDLRDFLGRIIGVNLEPVRKDIAEKLGYSPGRLATVENAQIAVEDGADILIITANPMAQVSLKDILMAVKEIRENMGDKVIIMAGKMHLAGVYAERLDREMIQQFAKNGADGIIMPAPGTIPGATLEFCKEIVEKAHENNLIVTSCIGTSQEGADEETIRRIAFLGKMSGADIHHIGDSGYSTSVALPENIMAYSIVIKGKRHTFRRIAQSILR